ncbi:hypothetical protein ARMSODRAFT_1061456 [Armillaria solidipes]|uniref:Uncharacterized protein n=1 Tax=Armillaria solidipes TaxID=1076256 RepID=A0A2H3B625_9AGAR|nr:hypothetical protein ARMSODRAFT_1061456 [Armillaria solidipes]
MTARTYLETATPELTDSEIKVLFVALDIQLNEVILNAFLYGVVAVTLWAVGGLNLYAQWVLDIVYFTTPKWESFLEAIEFVPQNSAPVVLAVDISAILSTLISTNVNLASRGIVTYYDASGYNPPPQALYLENIVSWSTLYASLILATLLWCTILIIFRILRVGGAAGRIHVYQRVIEMLVESASLYSAVLVVLVVFEARNELVGSYIEDLAITIRGIVPTILVGRVAAGHARPDDSWSDNTTASSIRFRNHSRLQNDSEMNAELGQDTLSSHIRPDLEEGLEDHTELRVEGDAPTFISYGLQKLVPVGGTKSNSIEKHTFIGSTLLHQQFVEQKRDMSVFK